MKNPPSTEERVWAVLSHLSAVALGMGIVLPIIGWSEQRRKSRYASFQCLQALGYQSLGYTIWILFSLLLVIILSIILMIVTSTAGGIDASSDSFVAIWTGIFVALTFGLFGIYLLPPIIAAIACALGRDFHYPTMGHRLASYLGYTATESSHEQTWLIEDHEDRWVASMGHFSILIILWGMLAPLTAWILQGNRSLFLKFQSIQTLVYQAGVTVLYVGIGIIYAVGFLIFIAATGFSGGADLNSFVSIAGIIIFGASMLVVFVIALIVPLLHILGQWAGYRVLKGDDYHYPIIGRMVEKRMPNNSSPPRTTA